MKISSFIIACIALIVSLFAITGSDAPQALTLNQGEQDRIVTLTGEAERFVAPDVAEVSFSVTRKAPNAQEALNSVNQRMAAIVETLNNIGLEESDVKTQNYSVNPEYRYVSRTVTSPEDAFVIEDRGNERVFDGYRVRQDVRVIIRDLENVERIMTQIGALEIDNVSNLSFRVDNDEQIREELRSEAIADAKEKAKVLSRDLGVRLETIVGFSEGGGIGVPYAARSLDFAESASLDKAVIPVGENELRAQVNVSFVIE